MLWMLCVTISAIRYVICTRIICCRGLFTMLFSTNYPMVILFWSVEAHMFSCLMDTTDVALYIRIGDGVANLTDTLILILSIFLLVVSD